MYVVANDVVNLIMLTSNILTKFMHVVPMMWLISLMLIQ